ncbi:MAG: LuxR C-terminal-related transcriptional regulator [Cephaloticoccus sp.]|nr:LuxR C-terminal-related transcriptional regulator [Cephaloticoccus sp.]MCF7759345.1 LuxR C-terminal-related transcriptional regulator [Cephaloticoccus sp.]
MVSLRSNQLPAKPTVVAQELKRPAQLKTGQVVSATTSWRQLAMDLANPPGATLVGLTPAEQVVITYLLQGLSNKEIAWILGKSAFTVKHQISSCLAKFGVSSRTRLIAHLR